MREAPRIILLGFLLIALFGGSDGQKRTKVGTSIAGSDIQTAADFECPEEFGYYPAPGDCTRYYVCVFGGALLESCTGGLAYSHELQTCDWPRNVDCIGGGTNNQVVATASKPKTTKPSSSNNPVTQFLEGSNSRTSQTSTKSRAPIEDLDELSMNLQDSRQGREFGSTASSRGSSKNTFTVQQETSRSSSSRPSTVDVEFDDDFVPATTFNPSSSRFLNRPAIETAPIRTTTVNPSTEQFFREVTSTVQKQQPTAPTTFDFEDWAKQHEQPSRAPVREQQQQQQQQVVRPTVESVAPPPARITAPVPSKSSQQQASRVQQPAVVDYDDFAAGEEEFVEYDDFSDVVPQTKTPVRQQQQEFEAPVRTTPATTTTTTTTTQRPKPKVTTTKPVASSSSSVRGASRFRPDAAASVEEEPDIPVQQTSSKRRPTLKPVSDLVPSKQASEPGIDIFKHPPKRLEPIFAQPIPDEPAAKCERDICRLPDCFCGGKDIPGGLKTKDVPQLVLLTFDDSVNDLNKELYKDLFETGRTNPNGCPIAATFYVSHEWTDYGQVQNLYADGHEIASHTISHSFGEQFSAKKWAKEAAGQRDVLAAYGGVRLEDVRGLRAPFLSVGGNRMFKMLYDLNFTYDSSMPVYENKPPSWPYTLDYKIFHDCMIPPCPTKSYPGVWEVPMVMWQDLNGGRCSMGDGCSNPPDAEGIYKMLIKNFERHYTSNRSPFPLYYHAAWFTTPHHKEGFEAFLDTIVSMDDVWLVTNWQAIQWVRDPTPLDRVKGFKPFQCDYPERPKRCNSAKVCNSWHKSGVRYMRTCQPCPEVFPWTGKTGVRNTFLDSYEGNEAS